MKPPTLNQVITYFRELMASPELAKAFFDRYQNNGWTTTRVSAETHWRPERRPMKRWKGAAKQFITRSLASSKTKPYRSAR